MKRWFERLPIHRKLVASALLITAVALALATIGLGIYDTWRYRASAATDAQALASVLAENLSAAVMFNQAEAAQETLQSVRVRRVIARVCVYHPDGRFFAGFTRDNAACPATPEVGWRTGWSGIVQHVPITRNGGTYGTIYVERDLSDLWARLWVTILAGLLMFAVAASAAYLLAQRVNAAISSPITDLAAYARAFGDDPRTAAPPPVRTAPDELGDLVTAFRDMVRRIQIANDELWRSNEALRHEQAEREAALARERRANLLKEEFLAAVSHELRTPLNAMMGWAQILDRAEPSPELTQKAVTSIIKNAQSQLRVIEDLLDVSRIVTGKLRLKIGAVDLRTVVASALEAMDPVAAARGLTLTQSVPGHPCEVAGDRDRLQQVLWNLVSNAVKFTPRGGTVRVDLRREDQSYCIEVADTGIGIPEEFLPHVFERFRQADGSMTREHGGLGLGLAIVKELTELHGGSVAATSAGRDQGSRFTILLPEYSPNHGQLHADSHA